MTYTVNALAKMSGVSGRTLRYYDQIGLLKPASFNVSGYRIYGQKEVDLLQQILFFRELEMSLEDIASIIQAPTFNRKDALKSHLQVLRQKRDRLDKLMATVEKSIVSMEEGIVMQDAEKFTGFKEKQLAENEQKYGNEIRRQYGDDTIEASNAKFRDMSQGDYQTMKELEQEILGLLEKAVATGNPASETAQQLAAKHKQWLLYSWEKYSKEAHAGLANVYVADERFKAYYDHKVKGGARFLRDAIKVFAGNN